MIGQSVVAGRVHYATADRRLPLYERWLFGGAANLRGFRPGAFDGDRLLGLSAELRVPITSVMNGVKLGATGFFDAGSVTEAGQPIADGVWHRGVGGGLFLIASLAKINLDVARGLKTGATRIHLSSGFNF